MDNLQDQIIALADQLRDNDDADDSDTGFIDNPGGGGVSDFIFLNRTEMSRGHMLDENGDPVPFPSDAVAGYMNDVYYESRTHEQYGLSQKLRVVLDTEQGRVMLETGMFSNTGKSLLANLAGVRDPGALLAIEPSLPENPDESPNVLFTELYADGELIVDGSADWPHENEDVIDLFNEVRREVFGFEPQEEQPVLPNSGQPEPSGRRGNGRSNGRGNGRSNGRSNGRGGNDRGGGSGGRGDGARSGNQHPNVQL